MLNCLTSHPRRFILSYRSRKTAEMDFHIAVSIHMYSYEVDAESGRKNKGFIRLGSIALTSMLKIEDILS